MLKKLLLLSIIPLSLANIANWEYTSVDCSSNATFWENSCNQCFDWWELKVWDTLSFLDDIWNNETTNKKIMYKEEQKMPVLSALNWAEFTKKPNDDTFWEYTPEFEALKDKEFDGYVLPAWQKVSWLKSSMWAAYKFDKSPTSSSDAWILVYDITSHDILESWEITMDTKAHKECVIFKAWAWVTETPIVPETPVTPTEPKPKEEEMTKVKTWPEEYLLVLMLSFLLWVWIMNRRLVLAKIKK